MVSIYTISDAKTGYVFYVGSTKNHILARFSNHKCNTPAIRYLIEKKGLTLVAEEIDTVEDDKDRMQCERFWIELISTWGFTLVNYHMNSNKVKNEEYEQTVLVCRPRKIYAQVIATALQKEAKKTDRSISYIIEQLLIDHFQITTTPSKS